MTITDIRHEGYYVEENDGEEPFEHTKETLKLFEKAVELVDENDYYVCDGVSFKDGQPFAELIDFEGGLHYKQIG